MKKKTSEQSYKNFTTQVRIDKDLHQLLKIKAAKQGESIKSLLEDSLAELLEVKTENEEQTKN